ncbi:MAG: hypothetical protein ACPL4I_00270 [Bacteroidota bacterium]
MSPSFKARQRRSKSVILAAPGAGLFIVALMLAITPLRSQDQKESYRLSNYGIGGMRDTTKQPPPRAIVGQSGTPPLPKIELPKFIITGVMQLHPPRVEKLPIVADEVRRRQTSASFLPSEGKSQSNWSLRDKARIPIRNALAKSLTGFLLISYGRFGTPYGLIVAGQQLDAFQYNVGASLSGSGGFAPNTDYFRGNAQIHISAPLQSKEAVLHGAILRGNAWFSGWRYRLYGSVTPEAIRIQRAGGLAFSLNSPTEIPFEYTFKGTWRGVSQKDLSSFSENTFYLTLNLSKTFASRKLDGEISYWANPIVSPFSSSQWTPSLLGIRLGVSSRVREQAELSGRVGLQLAQPNPSGYQLAPSIHGSISYDLSNDVVLILGFRSGYESRTIYDLLKINPYLGYSTEIHLEREKYHIHSGMTFPLGGLLRGSISLSVAQEDEFPEFVDSSSSGIWNVYYASGVTITKLRFEILGQLSEVDRSSLSLELTSVNDPAFPKKVVPYVPISHMFLTWDHALMAELQAGIQIEYRSSVFTDWSNEHAIAGVLVINAHGEYVLSNAVHIRAEICNALNATYYRWKGYRERPLFLSLGLTWAPRTRG